MELKQEEIEKIKVVEYLREKGLKDETIKKIMEVYE